MKARHWPNEVRSVADRLHSYCRVQAGQEFVPIVIAPHISERVATTCHELSLNWMDFAGNCHIRFAEVLIHIEGKPNPHVEKRGTLSLYTPQSARVVHALLLEPTKSWKVADLAERTQVSLGQVSNVRKLLVQNAFADKTAEGLRLRNAKSLLEDWAANYRPRRGARHFFSLKRPDDFETAIGEYLPSYALTEMSAAERYAPYTRYQRVSFYITEWRQTYVKDLDLRPAEGSANVTVYEDADGLLFSELHDGVNCSSPIITYLDLIALGGRGQDAAEHLQETTILPRWK